MISSKEIFQIARRPSIVSQLNIIIESNTVEVSYGDRSLKACFPDGMPGTTETITDVIRNEISGQVADMLSEPPCEGGYYNSNREFKEALMSSLYNRLIDKARKVGRI
jgi:hypothetical protein